MIAIFIVAAVGVVALIGLIAIGLSDDKTATAPAPTRSVVPARPRVPEPRPPDITLARYRRQLAEKDRQIAEQRQVIEQLMRQIEINGPVDLIVLFLDTRGAATTDDICTALGLDPHQAAAQLASLHRDERIIELPPNRWTLTTPALEGAA